MQSHPAGEPASARRSMIALARSVEPGDVGVGRLVKSVGADQVLDMLDRGTSGLRHGAAILQRWRSCDLDRVEEREARLGVRVVTPVDREWPHQLEALGDAMPLALWVLGAADLRLLALRSVAVVGARACSAYGTAIAHEWSAILGGRGWTVVSGAAYGIDAAAHRGSLAAGGTTVAVLAGGVDVPYPRAHDALLARIADEGLVVSESPLGEAVRRQRFLSRNRIIAAMSRATVVVEAALRSGASVTARVAADLNRVVLAVPGPVDSPTSAGCHRLVRDGIALLAGEVEDVLSGLDLDEEPHLSGRVGGPERGHGLPMDARARGVADRERLILSVLPHRGGLPLDRVADLTGLGPLQAWASLSALQEMGWVGEDRQGWRRTVQAPHEPGAPCV